LEKIPFVVSYVKNDHLDFTILSIKVRGMNTGQTLLQG